MADLKNGKILDDNMLEKVAGGVRACEDGALYPNGTIVTWKKRQWYVKGHVWDFDITSLEDVYCWTYELQECRGILQDVYGVPEHDLVAY